MVIRIGCFRVSLGLIVALFVPALLSASPILGTLAMSPVMGTFDIGGSTATQSLLNLSFNCAPGITGAPCPPPAPANGNFNVPAATGDFAAADAGYIRSLVALPVNQLFLLPDFITFPALPDIALDLTFLFPGVSGQADCSAAPAPGQTCTPAFPALVNPSNPSGLSPYNLQNIPGGFTASFAMAGIARRISTGETSNFQGNLTTQFVGSLPNYQTALGIIASGGTITNAYSATFSASAVPEPGTVSLAIGSLLLLVGAGMRRYVRKY